MLLYSMAQKPAMDEVLRLFPDIRIFAIADDVYIEGPPEDAFNAYEVYRDELAKKGVDIQARKSIALFPPANPPSIIEGCQRLGIKAAEGFVACGAPVGSPSYVQTALADKTAQIVSHVDRVATAIHAGPKEGKGSLTKEWFKILRYCLSPAMYNYLLRTTPTEEIVVHAAKYGDATRKVFHAILFPGYPADSLADPVVDDPLTRGIIDLKADSGGMGVTDPVRAAEGARIGNLALTSCIVGQVTGLHDPEDQRKAVPELAAFLAKPPEYAAQMDMLNQPLDVYFNHSVKNISAALGRARQASELKRVLNMADKATATTLLSQGQNGAAFMLADHFAGPSLTADQYRAMLALRVGTAPLAVFNSRPDPTCLKPGCGKSFDDDSGNLRTFHALECRGTGEGSPRGMANTRHTAVKKAMIGALERVAAEHKHQGLIGGDGAKGGAVGRAEPLPSDYFPLNPTANAEQAMGLRADIIVHATSGQSATLLDLVVTHPNSAGTCSKAHIVPGTCAANRYKMKMSWYSKHFILTDTSNARLFPVAIETHGRICPQSKHCIEDIVKDLTVGNKDPKDWTKKDASNYNRSLKFVLDSIGVALARVVASTIIAVAAGRKGGTTSGQVTDDADHAGGDQEPAEELASSQ